MTLPRSTANYNYSHNIAYKLFFLFFQVSVPLLLLVFISAIPYMYFCSIFYFMHACVCSSQTIIVPWKFLTISVMFCPPASWWFHGNHRIITMNLLSNHLIYLSDHWHSFWAKWRKWWGFGLHSFKELSKETISPYIIPKTAAKYTNYG